MDDRNSIGAVVFGEMARVNQVFVQTAETRSSTRTVASSRGPADGFADGSWSGRSLIFPPIENRSFFFFKKAIFLGISA